MLGPARKSPERLLALDRVEEWTRERFALPGDAAVHVWEIACAVPGCPPVETVAVFWIAGQRYQLKGVQAPGGGRRGRPSTRVVQGRARRRRRLRLLLALTPAGARRIIGVAPASQLRRSA